MFNDHAMHPANGIPDDGTTARPALRLGPAGEEADDLLDELLDELEERFDAAGIDEQADDLKDELLDAIEARLDAAGTLAGARVTQELARRQLTAARPGYLAAYRSRHLRGIVDGEFQDFEPQEVAAIEAYQAAEARFREAQISKIEAEVELQFCRREETDLQHEFLAAKAR